MHASHLHACDLRPPTAQDFMPHYCTMLRILLHTSLIQAFCCMSATARCMCSKHVPKTQHGSCPWAAPRARTGTTASASGTPHNCDSPPSSLTRLLPVGRSPCPDGQQSVGLGPPGASGPPEDRLHVARVEGGPPAVDAAGGAQLRAGALVQPSPAKRG